MNNAIWSEILKAALTILVLLASAAVPLVAKWVNNHLSLRQVALVNTLAQTAVNAAEQVAGVSNWTDQQKYDRAKSFLDDLANAHHLTLDEAQMKPLIEAAVHQLNGMAAGTLLPLQEATFTHGAVTGSDLTAQIEGVVAEALKTVVWHPEVPVKIN